MNLTKLIFCEHHFKLFRENGIGQIFKNDPKSDIRIRIHGKLRPTVCSKEHCVEKGKYSIAYK